MSASRGICPKLVLFVAQGFGIGRIPFAPGTFGSVLGLAWFGLLLWTGRLWAWAAGAILAAVLAIWICGAAEKLLAQRDPGSVVLDEIVALPFCFSSWVSLRFQASGVLPPVSSCFSANNLLFFAVGFLSFRLFDVWKPWPVRQSQALPGGWGVVVDDLLAAVYVNIFILAAWRLGWPP